MSGQLERLLAQATPGPKELTRNALWFWGNKENRDLPMERFEADVRLIDLAPDLARLLVDIVNDDGTTLRPSLLTRYLEIEQRAGEGQA